MRCNPAVLLVLLLLLVSSFSADRLLASSSPAPSSPIARVERLGGVPTLVVDGKPYGPMTYTRCAGTWEQLGQIAARRFPLYFEMVGNVGWPGKQEETFRRLDQHLGRFVAAVPNGKVILRLYLCAPEGFVQAYPEELLRFNDGSTKHFTKWYAMTQRPEADRGYPSFASQVWRQKTVEALESYVRHVRQSAYAGHVIGYFLCGGGTEEWYYWGDYDHNQYALDFSPPMLSALRAHLRKIYHGDVAALRRAWNDPSVDFTSALPPDPQMRKAVDGAFWEPKVAARLSDYYYVHNKVMEDSLLMFAAAVKRACRREQLVGMFHGYLQNHWFLEGGQATLEDLLRSGDVDFWSGPPQYNRRGQGEHGCIRFPVASLKAHGKLWINESDIRTSFSEPAPGNPALHGRPPGLEESLACLKREFAHQLCEGGNGWWFQMGKNWYHHEPVLSSFEQMQTVGEAAMGLPRASDTDIAAVIDLPSLRVGPPWPVSSSLLDAFKVQELCRIGTPVDYWLLSDILQPSAKRYKLYLMLNCFDLGQTQRQQIDQRLRRDGAVLVWMYSPGVFDTAHGRQRDPQGPQCLLGFSLASVKGRQSPAMRLTAEGEAAFPGFDRQRTFGGFERPQWSGGPQGEAVRREADRTTLPERFFAETEKNVLARFLEDGKPSIVRRPGNGWTDVWIGSVMAPADLLRSLARQAGCHLYCDGDEIIYANQSFLAIHTATSGPRTFRLRRAADVIEVFSGQVLGRGTEEFRDTIDAYRTRVYYLGPEATWKKELERAERFFRQFAAARSAGRPH